jgi:glycosyltransferase involved in cell wall biosynthesis
MPALNEEEGIVDVINSIPKKFEGIDKVDVLVVDDGCTDQTALRAKEAGALVVSHLGNKGVGLAFRTAVEFATDNNYDILVSIDADRQFNSEEIEKVIEPILKGNDMVTGNRFENGIPENMSKTKYWGNEMMSKLISLITGRKFRDVSCGFRAYGRRALESLNLYGQFTYTQESILDLSFKGFEILEVPVFVRYFPNRKSRVAGNVLRYAFKTSYIIMSFLVIYKPILILSSLLLLFVLTNTLLFILASRLVFTVNTIICSTIFAYSCIVVLFKNIRRVINNQERILSKIERVRHE